MSRTVKQLRVGIYAGTFDPVHAGHIAFALQAVQAAELDRVYFLPERLPRRKVGSEHFGHRVAMLKRALKPHRQFSVLELPERHLSVRATLPRLQRRFPEAQLVFLMGSDVAMYLDRWPYADRLLAAGEVVIGRCHADQQQSRADIMAHWPVIPRTLILDSHAPAISSTAIRAALRQHQAARGLLTSVKHYSQHHWLYVSLA
ncbi:MAG TPA: hypothetical protein VG992_02995 [Candidatus Saccharimonadales bacterium]|nr:hypothetical protein [Candidatus Saccharimonadales bacterium]